MAAFDFPTFRRQLTETITWCLMNFSIDNVKDSLRTITPQPPKGLLRMPENERAEWIHGTISQRTKNIRANNQTLGSNPRIGRLLIFVPESSFSDGAAAAAISNGFFDNDYFPASDTWVYYNSEEITFSDQPAMPLNYLITWVPPQMVEMVDIAVQSDIAESIQWLSDFELEFKFLKILKQNHLIF